MKLLAWSIEENKENTYEKGKYLLNTSHIYKTNVEFIGRGLKFNNLFDKLTVLRDYIETLQQNTFIVCIDGYDTLVNRNLSSLKEDFDKHHTKIIISSERMFNYQWGAFKDKFDNIPSPYKYVNSGTLIGYSDDIKQMLDECLELNKIHTTEIDQGIVGVWVYKNLENSDRVKLDTDCEFTWVVSGEWDTLGKMSENSQIINPTTYKKPYIIHSPGNGAISNFIPFEKAYNNIIKNN